MKNKSEPGVGYYPNYQMTQAEIEDQKRRLGEQNEKKRVSKPTAGRPKWNVRMMVMIACGAVFVISAALLINYYTQINRAKDPTAQLKNLYAADNAASQTDDSQPNESTAATAAPSVQPTQTEPPAQTLPPSVRANAITAEAPAATPDLELTFSALWPSAYANNPQLRIDESF